MDEKLQKLTPVELPFGKTIYQSRYGQGISSDIASFIDTILSCTTDNQLNVLELGTGCGIIALMLKYYRPKWNVTGIEIQSHLVDIAQKNCEQSNLSVKFIHQDLISYNSINSYDLIICNPPYYKADSGRISPIRERAVSRHEILCSHSDVVNSINVNLKKKGSAYLLFPLKRESELTSCVNSYNMKLDRISAVSFVNKAKVMIYRIRNQ